MIKLLTKKETSFLIELAAIIKKYDAVISVADSSAIRITIYEGETEKPKEDDIYFTDSFDEQEINELLESTQKQVEEMLLGYRADEKEITSDDN